MTTSSLPSRGTPKGQPLRRLWLMFPLLTLVFSAFIWGSAVLHALPSVTGLASLMRVVQAQPLPGELAAAVVEHEDRRFYQHGGLDLVGLSRALWASLSGGSLQGGSTLTQQLVKNTLLADQHGARTATRKLQEAWLAVQVEQRYSKTDILKAYLTVAYWGAPHDHQVVGAEQAARAYFGRSASQLDLARSAYLATLLPSPGRAAHPASVRPLVRVLLTQMVADGRVTRAQANTAQHVAATLAVLR